MFKYKKTLELFDIITYRLDWPVRTLSFSCDGAMLASASEDHFIDISCLETGEKICEVSNTLVRYPIDLLFVFY